MNKSNKNSLIKSSYQAPNTNKRIRFFYKTYDNNDEPIKNKKNRPASLFKYINLDSAIKCLNSDSIIFAEPICWDDEYESRFYSAIYNDDQVESIGGFIPRPLFSCCFATSEYSEPAWKVYTYGRQGLGNKCIQLELDFSKLLAALNTSFDKYDYSIYGGYVSYFSKGVIEGLHYNDSKNFEPLFGEFTIDKFLSLLLLKRDAYKYEDEYRLFIVPNKKDSIETIDRESILGDEKKRIKLRIKWSDIIKEIKYDSSFTESEVEILRTFCTKANIVFTEDRTIKDVYDALNELRKKETSLEGIREFYDIKEFKGNNQNLSNLIHTRDKLLDFIKNELVLQSGITKYEPDYSEKISLDEKLVLLYPFNINKMSGEKPIVIGATRKESFYDWLLQKIKEWLSPSVKTATRKP